MRTSTRWRLLRPSPSCGTCCGPRPDTTRRTRPPRTSIPARPASGSCPRHRPARTSALSRIPRRTRGHGSLTWCASSWTRRQTGVQRPGRRPASYPTSLKNNRRIKANINRLLVIKIWLARNRNVILQLTKIYEIISLHIYFLFWSVSKKCIWIFFQIHTMSASVRVLCGCVLYGSELYGLGLGTMGMPTRRRSRWRPRTCRPSSIRRTISRKSTGFTPLTSLICR